MDMLKKGDRVRHKDPNIDNQMGIMTIFEIVNGIAICGYLEYSQIGTGLFNYSLKELIKVNE